jgi:hypothetical protein
MPGKFTNQPRKGIQMEDEMTEQNNALSVTKMDASALEAVLIGGDLSKLTSPQRVQYYKAVCESTGLNPLTKPFDYITLKSKEGLKLTLYAKKDATDQLRKKHNVSIDDVDVQEVGNNFVVKVKGHDDTGRSDVEIGVVSKTDMFGDIANVQMKAVTKAKRRLTLSLCGLGWLDETEIETIPDARPVKIDQETGEILEGEVTEKHANTEKKPAPVRPYDPETVRDGIAKKVTAKGTMTVNEKQIGLLASQLETCFAGDKDSSAKRHTVTQYLTGKTSAKDLTGAEVSALLDWLKPTQDDGGAYTPNPMSVKEAHAILTQPYEDAGQMSLLEIAAELGAETVEQEG